MRIVISNLFTIGDLRKAIDYLMEVERTDEIPHSKQPFTNETEILYEDNSKRVQGIELQLSKGPDDIYRVVIGENETH